MKKSTLLISATIGAAFLIAGCDSSSGSGSGSVPNAVTNVGIAFESVKTFNFSWNDSSDATYYKLLENPDGQSGLSQVGGNIDTGEESVELTVSLFARTNAQYMIDACNDAGCASSATLSVSGNLAEAIGYFKASNTGGSDNFGAAVALSGDGKTLAVGANLEDSAAQSIDGTQADTPVSFTNSGAVYVFTIDNDGEWSQQAYIKAKTLGNLDYFGGAVSLSDDGNTLAVSATGDDNSDEGISSVTVDADTYGYGESGAVYVFSRSSGTWSQDAFIKSSNTDQSDDFGSAISLSGDGTTLAVGAAFEDSDLTTISHSITHADNEAATNAGAVYVYSLDSSGDWDFEAYIKNTVTASNHLFGDSVSLSYDGNTLAAGGYSVNAVYMFSRSSGTWAQAAKVQADTIGIGDRFGSVVSLSDDGSTLAVGAHNEDSAATGIDGSDTDDSATNSGAAYVFSESGGTWTQDAFIKASNTETLDSFGSALSLSGDGNALVVTATGEDGSENGIHNNSTGNSVGGSGAAYVFSKNAGVWSQQAYVKASNTAADDGFGNSASLSDSGDVLVVSATAEDGSATGVDGDQTSNSSADSGAVYLY